MLPISACLIVKNEEQLLDFALQSLRSLAREIIVVDTGSTDRTIEIAKKFTSKIFTFEWSNDFSAARNFAAEKASEDWILTLDADEVLDAGAYALIQEAIARPDIHAFLFTKRNYTNDQKFSGWRPQSASEVKTPRLAENFSGFVDRASENLYRNKMNIVWERRVHESFQPSCRRLGLKYERLSGVVVHHFEKLKNPYFLQSKDEAYLQMMMERLKDDIGNPAVWFDLAIEFSKQSMFEQAATAYEKAATLRPDWPEAKFNLALVYIRLNRFVEAERLLQMLLSNRKETDVFSEAELLGRLSTAQLYQKKFSECEITLQRALSLDADRLEVQIAAGVLYFEKENWEASRRHFEKAKTLAPDDVFVSESLQKIDRKIRP